MEKILKKLLDYQRFEQNEKLGKLIRETESRFIRELSDEDLSLVNAAGEITPGKVEADSGFGAAGIGSGTQIGGFTGDCKTKGGVSGFNTGASIGTGGGGGGEGAGGSGAAM